MNTASQQIYSSRVARGPIIGIITPSINMIRKNSQGCITVDACTTTAVRSKTFIAELFILRRDRAISLLHVFYHQRVAPPNASMRVLVASPLVRPTNLSSQGYFQCCYTKWHTRDIDLVAQSDYSDMNKRHFVFLPLLTWNRSPSHTCNPSRPHQQTHTQSPPHKRWPPQILG